MADVNATIKDWATIGTDLINSGLNIAQYVETGNAPQPQGAPATPAPAPAKDYTMYYVALFILVLMAVVAAVVLIKNPKK